MQIEVLTVIPTFKDGAGIGPEREQSLHFRRFS